MYITVLFNLGRLQSALSVCGVGVMIKAQHDWRDGRPQVAMRR